MVFAENGQFLKVMAFAENCQFWKVEISLKVVCF